ncbi:MAG: hypothetical protein Roseis2KO_46070 [Roseivirga sp.]
MYMIPLIRKSTVCSLFCLTLLFSFTLKAQTNQDPVFKSSPITNINDDVYYRYEISVEDVDNDLIEISALNLPSWLALSQNSEGVVTTLAGSFQGFLDGTGGNAFFSNPDGIDIDDSGNLYIADVGNHRIRKITPEGVVSTLAGSVQGYADGTGTSARFDTPIDLTLDGNGNVYVADTGNHRIRRITPEGVVTTIAGSGNIGYLDGIGTNALFTFPLDIVVDHAGNLFVSDLDSNTIRKITPSLKVSTFAGGGESNNWDGLGTEARIGRAEGMVVDIDDNIYFGDTGNNTIRKVTKEGLVTTIAGSGDRNFRNGTASESSFSSGRGLALDHLGNIFVADQENNKIRRISPDGKVSTVAGGGVEFSNADGTSDEAAFLGPSDMVFDQYNNLYVVDRWSNRIRKISFPYALLEGNPSGLHGVFPINLNASDGNGNPVSQSFDLEINDISAPLILSIKRASLVTALSTDFKFLVTFSEKVSNVDTDDFEIKPGGATASVISSEEVVEGLVFEIKVSVTESVGILDLDIKEVNDIQDQQTQALGSVLPTALEEFFDFQNQAPSFTSSPPATINAGQEFLYRPQAVDPEGSSVALSGVNLPDWLSFREPLVSTIAGGLPQYSGYADGFGEVVRFRGPSGSAFDAEGNLYIADSDNHRIRKIDINGHVTTLAGSVKGDVDGVGDQAQLGQISFIEMGGDGFLYVVDITHHKIKRVSLDGEVTTYAGSVEGADDGDISVATFSLPINLRYRSGTIYVTDNKGIRIIEGGKTVSTLELTDIETNTPFSFNTINGFEVDENGNFYVADRDSYNVYKVTPDGSVSVWAGSVEGDLDGSATQAMFGAISSLELDDYGNLYVTDIQFSKVRRIDASGYSTTVAGGIAGALDGEVSVARFRNPTDVTYSPDGNLIICDRGNQQIRRIELNKTLAGTPPSGITQATIRGIIRATDNKSAVGDQAFSFDIVSAVLPEFTSSLSVNFEENGVDMVYQATVNNENDVTYSISDELDASGFYLTSNGGLYFKSPPDFEAPTDGDRNNTYEVEIFASNRSFSTSQRVSVHVMNLSDEAPSFVSTPVTSVNSDQVYSYLMEVVDLDGDEVTLTGENLPSWISLQDNLLQGDPTGQIGPHTISVKAIDTGGNFSLQEFDLIVNDAAFPVFISDNEVVVNENASGVIYKALAAHAETITYSLGDMQDESVFAIDPASGDLSFLASPDFENPVDENANNYYELIIKADNGSNISELGLRVKVINVNEQEPIFNSVPVTSVDDNAVYTYAIDVSDSDGDAIQLEAEFLPEWLSIDPGSYVIESFVGAGTSGSQNGAGTNASFNAPYGIEVDPEGNLFVADGFNNQIRKVTPAGVVTTFATGLDDPSGLAMDPQGNLYVAEYNGFKVVKITPDGSTSVLAGSDFGLIDGTGTEARFSVLTNIVFGPDQNLYVTDYLNHSIRKVTLDGVVTTVAGSGSAGFIDGTGTLTHFNNPSDLTFDTDGNIYVTDTENAVLRKIDPEGVVSTLAGSGKAGFSDGEGTLAEFNRPFGITFDKDNNLIVADFNNRRLRKVTTSGVVTTILGSGAVGEIDGTGTDAGFNGIGDIAFDKSGNLYVSTGNSGNSIRKVSLTAPLIQGDATGIAGEHSVSLKATDAGGFYATQDFTIVVNDVTPPVFVSPAAVSFQENSFQSAYTAEAFDTNSDMLEYSLGTGNDEALFSISGFSGIVSFQDTPDFENPADNNTDNSYIIEVNVSDGVSEVNQLVTIQVTDLDEGGFSFVSDPITRALRNEGYSYVIETSSTDGSSLEITAEILPSWIDLQKVAQVTTISGDAGIMTEDNKGNFYGILGNQIMKLDAFGKVSVLAGSEGSGLQNGTGTEALFYQPRDIEFGPDGNLYVADTRNHVIRKVDPDGVVTTFAGTGSTGELVNGASDQATFARPSGLIFDSNNNLLVADSQTYTIRKITPDGVVSTFAGKLTPYFANYGNGPVFSRYLPDFADGAATDAKFGRPFQMVFDSKDNLYVTDRDNDRIRMIQPNGEVSTFAGSEGGFADGVGTAASFSAPTGITIDDQDRLFVTAGYLRMITPDGTVTTIAGNESNVLSTGVGKKANLYSRINIFTGRDGFMYVPESRVGGAWKIDLLNALVGDPFHHVGSHSIVLKASEGSEEASQSFTLVVEDNVQPAVEQIVRANPVEEVISTDWTQFLVQFSEPVVNVRTESFELKKGDLLADVTKVTVINDSLYNITVSGIDGFGVLDLDLAGTHSMMDVNGLSLTAAAPETEETYSIEANTPPVFLSQPETEVLDGDTYNYAVEIYDADADSVSFEGSDLPSWLGLNTGSYQVSTLAGSGSRGSKDGVGTDAIFRNAYSMTTDRLGNIYVVDFNGQTIRKVSSAGVVTTVSNRLFRTTISSAGTTANPLEPNDLIVDDLGNIYFTSERYNTIEKLNPIGELSTLAGGEAGYSDGTGTAAAFDGPYGMALDPSGNIIIADRNNNRIRKVTPEGVVTTIATSGDDEGLMSPYDVAVDNDGNIYVADQGRRKIKKIDTNNVLTTYAGSSAGEGDGTRLEAGFRAPIAVEVDDEGNVYVADVLNYAIRKIDIHGMVTTIAGSPTGGMNGVGIEAPLSDLGGLALSRNGKLYATTNTTKVIELSKVINLTGNPSGQAGSHPVSLRLNDGRGGAGRQDFTIEVSDDTVPVLESIVRLNPIQESTNCNTVTFRVTFNEALRNVDITDFEIKAGSAFGSIVSLRLTANPAIFDVEVGNLTGVGSLDLDLVSLTDIRDVAGNPLNVNTPPSVEEVYVLSNADPVFESDPVVLINSNSNYSYQVLVSDIDVDALNISATTLPDWLMLTEVAQVSTTTGNGTSGNTNGTGTNASFGKIEGVAIDSKGNVYLADTENNQIRILTMEGVVSTFAGSLTAGTADGNGTNARFSAPSGLAIDGTDNIYVSDRGNFAIRKITPTGDVTTLAGGIEGYSDANGTAAKFTGPSGIAATIDGTVYVSDFSETGGHRIRKVATNGEVSTIAGGVPGFADGLGTFAQFSSPAGLTLDSKGNLLVADTDNHRIRKISPVGFVSTLAGNGAAGFIDARGTAAQFSAPSGITIDLRGNILIADSGNERIRKIDQGMNVSTLGGGDAGFADGTIEVAEFFGPMDLAVDGNNNIFVADSKNYRLRKIVRETSLKGKSGSDNGEYPVVLNVNDGNGGSTNQEFIITVDGTGPELAISSDENEYTSSSSFTITLALSEEVTGFTSDDISVSNGTLSDFTGSGTSYMATVTPIIDGEVTVNIAADLMTDAVGNGNLAATEFSIIFDGIAPVITIDTDEPAISNSSSLAFTFTLSEEVTGFTADDISVDNAVLSDFSRGGLLYSAILTPVADGNIAIGIADGLMTDLAGNENVPADPFVITSDRTKPSITISSNVLGATRDDSFSIVIELSETVTDFTVDDISVGNATLSEFTGNGNIYSAVITPIEDGEVTVGIAADQMTDFAGNGNIAATQWSVISDRIAPVITISSDEPVVSNSATFEVLFALSEEVNTFSTASIMVQNGSVVGLEGSGTAFTATVEPEADGSVVITALAGLTDAAGNSSESTAFSLVSDQTSPQGVITGPTLALVNQAFTVTIEYDESVSDLTLTDLFLTNAVASDLTSVVEGEKWTALVTPSTDGTVTITLPEGSVSDVAGNPGKVTNLLTTTFDGTAPEVSAISRQGDNPLLTTEATFEVIFTEDVTGVDTGDFELATTGTTSAIIGSVTMVDARTYQVTINQVLGEGSIGLNLKADDSIMDVAGNLLRADFTGESYTTNFSPTDITLSSNSVNENSGVAAAVGMLTAVDADAGDTHVFTLVLGDGSEDNGSFTINDSELQTLEDFDFETKSTYNIRVKADDGQGGTFERTLTIIVGNVSEPGLTLEGTLEFGQIGKNLSSDLGFTINNTGDGPLDIISLSLPDGFSADWSGGTVPLQGSQTVTVTFSPTEVRQYSGDITINSAAGMSTISVSGEGTLVTSTDEDTVGASDIKLYPNPASKLVTIDLSAYQGRQVTLIIQDMTGRTRLVRKSIREEKVTLDVGSYEEGMFIIQIGSDNSKVYKKFLIKR